MARPGAAPGGLHAAAVTALVVLLAALTFGFASTPARADPSSDSVIGIGTNGNVDAITELGGNVYLGGDFTAVGLATGAGALLDPSSAAANTLGDGGAFDARRDPHCDRQFAEHQSELKRAAAFASGFS